MMMAVMALVSFTAKADFNVTLKVDDATRMTAYYQYTDDTDYSYHQIDLDLTQFTGDGGTFTIPSDYGYVYIYATDGNVITSAVNETTGYSESAGTSVYFYLYSDAVLSVQSADLNATRTASCTVNVDDASQVNLAYGSGDRINLVDGENIVKFNPETEVPFQLSHVNYGSTLYSVKLNDVEQEDSYGRYYLYDIADGAKLDILAKFPELPATISFSYGRNEEEVLGCVSVKVNGEKVEDFDGKSLSVMLGDKVTIVGNSDLYNYNYSIIVNGSYESFYGEYEFVVAAETNTIEINATKYTTISAYMTVDVPENIETYAGTSNTPLSFVAGEATKVEVSSNSAYISLRPTADCSIVSITVNGVEYGTVNGYGTYSTTISNLNDGDQIIVTTAKIARDNVATIWVDDLSGAPYGYQCARYSDRASVDLISGVAVTVNFDVADNPYGLNFYGPSRSAVYQNGVKVSPTYTGGHNYNLTLANGDAVEAYLVTETEDCTVAFTDSEGVIASVATNGQDYANWATGFTVLKDTKLTITLSEGSEYLVVANGESVAANEDGAFDVVVTANTEITLDKTNAIKEIFVNNVENSNVYNLQGILVVKNATAEQVSALPAGLYIINGKKVVLK